MTDISNRVDEQFGPLLGEFVWHSVTNDPTLHEVSALHHHAVASVISRYGKNLLAPLHILEVAAYAHTSGYTLSQQLDAKATLLDISANTLRLGRKSAHQEGLNFDDVRLVAADFHHLPFEDGQFHVVYICSALHHTRNWQKVLSELVRVLAPSGLLLLENEPCLREFCFYRFRTNRVSNFTPFETKLDALGLIRTIAEPYLGSRPETLFGMVENQTIPLDELKNTIERDCNLLELSVTPEVCMGSLEQELVRRRAMDASKLTSWLESRLGELISQAAPALSKTEKGLGFSLPDKAEIASLCEKTMSLLKELPSPITPNLRQRLATLLFRVARLRRKLIRRLESLPLPAIRNRLTRAMSVSAGLQNLATQAAAASFSDDSYREGLARLFGASVKIVAQKKGSHVVAPEGKFRAAYPEQDGVVLGFEPAMLRLLGQCGAFSPDLQTSRVEEVHHAFPHDDWAIETTPAGIRSLVSRAATARMLLPLPPGRSLILLRCHGAYCGSPYRILLLQGGRELAGMDMHQPESFLLSGMAETSGTAGRDALFIKMVFLGNGEAMPHPPVSITYASAVAL